MAQSNAWDRLFEGPPQGLINPSIREETPTHGRQSRPGGRRPDIQGLRALAVILVIVDHLGSWPHGGFIGVDVFFVISGFLITNLLLRSAQRGQSVRHYFGSFYLKRARRILPAAVVVLIASWIAASLVFKGTRVAESHSDTLWAGGFLANVHFAHIGTDYFQAGRAPSLVQHFWSLSVEEQFYLLWPVVVVLVIAVLARRRKGGVTALFAVVVLLTIASLVWAIHETLVNPTAAYFSPFVRAWELGVGACVAVAVARWPHAPRSLGVFAGPLALLGLAGILVSAVVIRSDHGFPAPAALWPELATAAVIFAGSGNVVPGAWFVGLASRPATYVGDISYSLYLWHWPSIVVTAALISRTDDSGLFYVVVLTATLGLSVFSYQFIERPIHEPREVRRGADRRTAAYAALAAAALLVTTLALYAFKPAPRAGNYTAPIPKITQTSIAAPAIAPNPKIGQQITEALQSTSFPTLNPSLDSLGLSAAEAQWAPCEYGGTVRQSCMFGPPRTHKTALVMGDSVSLAWMPAITHALPKWRVVGIARQQCAAAYVEEKAFTTGQRDTVCDRVHASYARTLASVKPDLVIMSSTEGTLQQLVNHDTPAAEQYTRGMTRTIRLAQQAGAEVVVLSPPPRTRSLVDCDTSGGSPSDCVQPIEDAWFTQSSLDSAVAQKTHATYINTRRWFCSLRGYCPAFIGKTPVTYDGAHLTTAFAVRTAPEFAASLPHR